MHSIFILLLLTTTTTLVLSSPIDQQWNRWKKTHQKIYSDAEEHHRRMIWEKNLKKVQDHNIKADLGLSTYWLGMNKFADLTVTEFSKMIAVTKKPYASLPNKYRSEFTRNPSIRLPDTVDWRQKGYVTPIKDQRECTGGWAFSATGAVEGQHFNATGQLISLSEQNLIDCSDKQGNIGCVGGQATQAFEYIKENGGIDTEDSYPFEDDVNRCRFKSESVAANVTGYVNIKSKNESALQEAVAIIGPVAVNIDSSHDSFQLYKQGIYHEIFCSQVTLDHGMLVVGYGTDSGKEYWLVKNSFGAGWGEQGYIRMTRNKRNECGIATAASYPLV